MLKPVPAREASGLRHDVPQDLRRGAMELKTLVDRYAGALGHHWIADEDVAPTAGLLLQIARISLNLHEEHAKFLAETWKDKTP